MVNSQNLVPNPSFEEAAEEPEALTSGNNFTCLQWFSPSHGTPDYFISSRDSRYGTKANIWGNREPFTGNAYVGIFFGAEGHDNWEYLQVKLNQKLIKNKTYCLKLKICPGDIEAFTTNELDFCLSSAPLSQSNSSIIRPKSFEKFVCNYDYFIPKCWNEISACYIAQDEEEYLTIGMFNKINKKVNLSRNPEKIYKGSYFYIDEVNFYHSKDTLECNCNTIKHINDELNLSLNNPIVLKNINFETGKSILLESSFSELNKLVSYLKTNSKYNIQITGHTDNSGNENENVKLSNQRACSVADYLIKGGVAKNRIKHAGLGSKKPLKPNDSEANKLLNRRVEVNIVN